jgi:chemotaxis signal transduction protein
MHALSSKILGVARLDDGLVYLLDVDKLLAQGLLGEEVADA